MRIAFGSSADGIDWRHYATEAERKEVNELWAIMSARVPAGSTAAIMQAAATDELERFERIMTSAHVRGLHVRAAAGEVVDFEKGWNGRPIPPKLEDWQSLADWYIANSGKLRQRFGSGNNLTLPGDRSMDTRTIGLAIRQGWPEAPHLNEVLAFLRELRDEDSRSV
jgi:hypothetical protein